MVNRGAAYADGRIVFNTLDRRTIAVDTQRQRGLANPARRHQPRGIMTMAPLIVKDKVLVGLSGGDSGFAAGFPHST